VAVQKYLKRKKKEKKRVKDGQIYNTQILIFQLIGFN